MTHPNTRKCWRSVDRAACLCVSQYRHPLLTAYVFKPILNCSRAITHHTIRLGALNRRTRIAPSGGSFEDTSFRPSFVFRSTLVGNLQPFYRPNKPSFQLFCRKINIIEIGFAPAGMCCKRVRNNVRFQRNSRLGPCHLYRQHDRGGEKCGHDSRLLLLNPHSCESVSRECPCSVTTLIG